MAEKIINLFDRSEHVPDVTPSTVNGVDQLSVQSLALAHEMASKGELFGVCIIGLDKDGEPIAWSQFPPGTSARTEAMRYMGLCDILKRHLEDVAIYGLDELARIAEQEEGDDAS